MRFEAGPERGSGGPFDQASALRESCLLFFFPIRLAQRCDAQKLTEVALIPSSCASAIRSCGASRYRFIAMLGRLGEDAEVSVTFKPRKHRSQRVPHAG